MKPYNKHILIAGSARSGTSWLSEIIAQQHRYRMLFEPEHEFRTPKGHLLCDQWLHEGEVSKAQIQYLKAVFANRVDCDWIGQISNRKYKRHLWPFIPKMYVIKMVRGNLLANYVNTSFNLPTIHIIRNPYEVIHSQLRVSFPWLFDLSLFTKQTALVNLIKQRFNYDISTYDSLSAVQRLTLRWCIENVISLEVLERPKHKFEVVRHEVLLQDITFFYGVCERFVLEPLSDLELRYKNPSSKMHPRSKILSESSSKSALLDAETMQEINSILNVFKTQLYPIVNQYFRKSHA